MNQAMAENATSEQLAANIPYLRRFARAITGSQKSGDNFAAAALEAILADRSVLAGDEVKLGLYKVFYGIWSSAGAPVEDGESGAQAKAQRRLAGLTGNSREALLLHTVEGFSYADTAKVIGVTEAEADQLITVARREIADSASGLVMIIEDEVIIATDLENIVAELGHRVTGIARTRDEAVKLAGEDNPDLILADIQLADNSSGIDAVKEILEQIGERPVIFITAFPERLLTGDKPEPAFLISKPYTVDQVVSYVSHAMFFASNDE